MNILVGLVVQKLRGWIYKKIICYVVNNIAVLASGAGSNAQKIIHYFKEHSNVCVKLVVCNNPAAGVHTIASDNGIPVLFIEKQRFFHGDAYLPELEKIKINFIVLAGFLWKIPVALLHAFENRIINIHPALLPKYGGKGMYGSNVHQAVIDNHEKESGITIHYVDDKYDNGNIIFQATCEVKDNDTANSLAQRVSVLEHKYYPEVIEDLVLKSSSA